MTVFVIRDWTALHNLRYEWDELAGRVSPSSPFQSAFVLLHIAHREDPCLKPLVIIARDTEDRLAGVLPLAVREVGGRLVRHQLVPLAEWHASSFRELAIDEHVAQSLWRHLKQDTRGWDVADLRFVEPDSPLLQTTHISEPGGLAMRVPFREGEHRSPRDLAKKLRRLAREHDIQLNTNVAEPTSIQRWLNKFVHAHTTRWSAVANAAEYSSPVASGRLARMVREGVASGLVRCGQLDIDGNPVAFHLAFRWSDMSYSWRTAVVAGHERWSPGSILYDVMLGAAAQDGCTAADLGRGSEEFKTRWHPVTRRLTRVRFAARNWRGRLASLTLLHAGSRRR